VRLDYQRTFRVLSSHLREWHSLSGEFRPDYVVSFEKDGACAGWLILDAKYRTSRASVHDALRELHVYRDALRRRGKRADAAFIIVPGLDEEAAAYAEVGYVGTHAFGAVVSAGNDEGLVATLRRYCGQSEYTLYGLPDLHRADEIAIDVEKLRKIGLNDGSGFRTCGFTY
jgi:hypothetical protein